MSDRFGSNPPDEPVIGANYPPAPPPPGQGAVYIGAQDSYDAPVEEEAEDWEEEPYDDEYGYDEDEYYGDEYYEGTPARQPMFYVFIGLAALIGGLVIFLLFTLFNSGGDDAEPGKPATGFNVQIDFPKPNARIEIGKPQEVSVSASSNEPITGFMLLIGGRSVDQVAATSQPVDKGYRASGTLRTQFDARGDYDLVVRVTSSSGAIKDSSPVRVIAIEGVGDKPQAIKGKVQTDVNVRTGPGENFELVKTLKAGEDVTIIGKTRDKEWLLIDLDGQQRWVKRSAIQEQDSLDLVLTRDPTPRPEPTATNTPVPSPSPSRSPSPSPNAPDFGLKDAILIDGGAKLRVTVTNQSTNNFSGSLVVSVSGVNPGTLTQAFGVNIPANGNATVDFELNPPVTSGGKTAQVKVDPDNAIKELNEDNNSASFGLQPPVEQPQLVVTVTVEGGGASLRVGISNSGGPLATTNATIKVTLGADSTTKTVALAINKGGNQTVSGVLRPPGTGEATVEVIVGNQTLASAKVQLQ